jgi:hypothetical protein
VTGGVAGGLLLAFFAMDAQRKDDAAVAPARRAEVIPLDFYRTNFARGGRPEDELLNAEWDTLARLAQEAWTWRDPESLAALGACVARLGLRSLEDWGV